MIVATCNITLIYQRIVVLHRDCMAAETKYTDEMILNALRKCLEEAVIPSSEVAEKLGANPRYIKDRLADLKEHGILTGKIVGNTWCFRPITSDK